MRWVAASLVLLAVACGSDAPTAPVPPSVAGTWTLRTIDGAALPYVIELAGADKIELLDASITAASGSFTSTSTERTTINGSAKSESFSEMGKYSINQAAVTFTFDNDSSMVTGSIRGDSLTFTDGGVVVVYRKR